MTQPTHPFTLLADPVRRRIVEVLAVGERSAGTLCDVAMAEFGISRTPVSHHLRVLRDHHAVTSTIDTVEPRARSYRLNTAFSPSSTRRSNACSGSRTIAPVLPTRVGSTSARVLPDASCEAAFA